MIEEKDDAFLATNLKGLMMTLLGEWNARMDEGRAATEFASIRPSDMRVFGQLRGRTVKLSMVHRELGFSRQAAQQSVDRLVGHGVLAVAAAPDSRRDKMVSVTEKGQRLRALAARQIREIEIDCAEAVGSAEAEAMRRTLMALVERARDKGLQGDEVQGGDVDRSDA